jgi:hypothetical protein
MSRFYSGEYASQDVDQIESIDVVEYINPTMVTFFVDNDLGFRIVGSLHLVHFLRRLDRIGLLSQRSREIKKMIPMKGIIKFWNCGIWKWNIDIFKDYLKIRKRKRYNPLGRHDDISRAEYKKYIELIK